ncbi:hypothetical protein EMCRGX_G007325 [Ephydatia muelleri]
MAETIHAVLDRARIYWASDSRKSIISFRSPLEIWAENPTFLLVEVTFLVWVTLTMKHALRSGGRFSQLWCAALLHGLVIELLSYTLPDVDNFWHFQGTAVLFNTRLPLYITFLYPCFYYTAYVAVSRLKLSVLLEPFALAICVVLLDVPYDILGVKLLWWTWHDTDPNLYDRTYYVPWTSYMFHLTFASTFLLILNTSRALLSCGDSSGEKGEGGTSGGGCASFVGVVLAGCLSMPLAVLGQMLPAYNFPHDVYGIHTEVLLWTLLGTYVVLVWIGTQGSEGRESASSRRHRSTEVCVALVVYYTCIGAVLMVGARPETYSSTGLHQTIGNCSVVAHTTNVLGQKLPKQAYLCASSYDEPFSLLCANAAHPATNGASYYTICGTSFPNSAEYKCIIVAACMLGAAIYYQLLFRSGMKAQKQKKN